LFIGISIATGLSSVADIENMKKVLKKVPPAWWISKPILELVVRLGTQSKKLGKEKMLHKPSDR
ncbi:MAG: hypothetical protein P1Q69_15360, partial [Candidatus Thorarchaeota archaeon]|nr:hypothetical protein [Candidatus Thorarchaeota archaeon]